MRTRTVSGLRTVGVLLAALTMALSVLTLAAFASRSQAEGLESPTDSLQGSSLEVSRTPQIVGGKKVYNPLKYRFMARLATKSGTGYEPFCGGTLINKTTILTAAHCVDGKKPENMRVAVGRKYEFVLAYRDISAVRVHPRYETGRGFEPYDVALLKLKSPVRGITPIKVATSRQNYLESPPRPAIALGWGRWEEGAKSRRLREVSIPLVSDQVAKEKYGNNDDYYISPIMLAAGGDGDGTCGGDSGGPLFSKTLFGPIQIGVTSFTQVEPCGGFPSVFSEVNNPFIEKFIKRGFITPLKVTNTNDSGSGSLRQAIINANANDRADVIRITATGTVTLRSALPELNTDMEIVGPGKERFIVKRSEASGTPDFRIFTARGDSSSTVVISGLTVTNGAAVSCGGPYACGGGIFNTGGTLAIKDSIITGNSVITGDGGGIANREGTLLVKDSTISGNTASSGGFSAGGSYIPGQGGGVRTDGTGSTLTVRGSTISGNSAEYGGGGISSFAVYSAKTAIYDSSISNNSGGTAGGGIYGAGDLLIGGSTVDGNNADRGGGISSHKGRLSSDPDKSAFIINSTISGNSAEDAVGGVSTSGSFMGIWYSTITDNTSPGEGNGVSSYGADSSTDTATRILSSIIADNTNTDVNFTDNSVNSFESAGYNLIGDGNATAAFDQTGDRIGVTDPGLENLADNGGPTRTHALQSGSLAVDTGPEKIADNCIDEDQRGEKRPQGDRCDKGAYELLF